MLYFTNGTARFGTKLFKLICTFWNVLKYIVSIFWKVLFKDDFLGFPYILNEINISKKWHLCTS